MDVSVLREGREMGNAVVREGRMRIVNVIVIAYKRNGARCVTGVRIRGIRMVVV